MTVSNFLFRSFVFGSLLSLDGYAATPFSEDFSDNSPGPQLVLGAGAGTPTVDFVGDFTITSGNNHRIYLGTADTDYSTTSFVCEAEVTFPVGATDWSIVFFGLGSSDALGIAPPTYGEPGTIPNALMSVWPAPANQTLRCKDNTGNILKAPLNSLTMLEGNTHLMRYTWNHLTGEAFCEFDQLNDGSIDGSFSIDGSDNGFDATNSQLILGGGNMVSFDNISVFKADSDTDGMLDHWEITHFGDITTSDGTGDGDTDNLNDKGEHDAGTNPAVADTDTDGLNDGAEVSGSDNPWLGGGFRPSFVPGVDPAGDSTDPLVADTDGDGLSDHAEVVTHLTDANNVDTDGDGLGDGEEVNLFSTDPLVPDASPEATIDPSGIVATAGSSLDGPFGPEKLLDGQTVEGGNPGTGPHLDSHWLSDAVLTETVTFDLGGTYDLSRLNILNTSNSGWNDSTTETFTIATSSNGGGTYSSPSSAIPLQDYTAGFQKVPVPAGVPGSGVTHVRLVATAFAGSVRVGLNEVEFVELVNPDADADGMLDAWEIAHFGDTATSDGTGDAESDGLTDKQEHDLGTDPHVSDSDGDGLGDGDEVNTHGTNPAAPDSDDDGVTDGDEVLFYGIDPLDVDTDGDGGDDGAEILYGSDPANAASSPPTGYKLAGVTSPGTVGPYLDSVLPNRTPGGGGGSSWAVVDAFPSLSFADLKGVTSEPNANYIAVVERRGTVQRVEYDSATTVKTQILDITAKVDQSLNGGLRTVVFHPDYNQPGSPNEDDVYVFYTTRATVANGFSSGDNSPFLRVSRFTRNAGTGLIPSSSEVVMIQQRTPEAGAHFAGGMVFGMDGFLYISWGDCEFTPGTVGVPFYQDSQRIDRIFQSAVICVDVDQLGGVVSTAPTRTLQGNTGPNAMAGTTQSCVPGHAYYHVDNHSGVGYYIPKQNYWHKDNNVPPPGVAGISDGVAYPVHGPALEEHVAIGMRNPWRLAADPVDGHIAWFSVGSNASPKFEEVEVLVQGGNYGWPYREGDQSQTFETGRDKPPGANSFAPVYLGTEVDPVMFYPPSMGSVSVGGVMYRGTTLGSVPGKLINADHGSGKIWSIDYKGGGTPVMEELIDTSLAIRQMTPGPSGEDVLIAANGNIHRLVDTSPPVADPPSTLSGTGAFLDLSTLTPRAGLLPYEPIAPLWSDRAGKPRFMAVPNDLGVSGEYDHPDQKVLFSEGGPWAFPIGTTFVKHFTLPLDEGDPGNPALQQKIETRFLVHGIDGNYYGFTYRWRSDQTDADLIPVGGTSGYDVDLTVTRADDSTYTQTWRYPSRAQCFDCHQAAPGRVLGLRSHQLNEVLTYPSTGNTANQLATFSALGMFDQELDVVSIKGYLTSKNVLDTTATLEARVHSYLDSNCAHCHQPGGNAGEAVFDARLTTPFVLAGIIDEDPRSGYLGLTAPKIVKPGDPANSVLYHRDSSGDPAEAMPPLAKSIQDAEYIDVLERWIKRIGYSNFDSWATANGVLGGLDDDDDGDELSNGFEFLLGLDGAVPNRTTGITIAKNGESIEYGIPLAGAARSDGLNALIEDSNDLTNWFEAGTAGSILTMVGDTSAPGVDGIQTWQFIAGPRGFARAALAP